jgi:hypothetical protein
MTHWKTTFDPNDGEPIGTLCHCDIDDDHDGAGEPMGFDEPVKPATTAAAERAQAEGITGMGWDNLGHGGS